VLRYRDGTIPAAGTDPQLAGEFEALPGRVAQLLGEAEATQALELIWQRVRRLNRYVEERAPWQLARDPEQAGRLDQTLASLAEGIRALSVLLTAYMPDATARLLEALGSPATDYDAGRFAAQGSGARVAPLAALFPKQGS